MSALESNWTYAGRHRHDQPARSSRDDKKKELNSSTTTELATAPQKHLRRCAEDAPERLIPRSPNSRRVVRDNLLPGLRACQGRVPPPFASRKFDVEPLLVVPCFVFRHKPDDRWNDIDGAVARDQPLALQVGEHNKAATVRPLVAVRLCIGAPQRRHAECRPRDADVIEGHVNRRETALSIGVSSWRGSRSTALLMSPVSATSSASRGSRGAGKCRRTSGWRTRCQCGCWRW